MSESPESTQNSKLFHKDFTLVVIGQIISLFGNAILRFALPLYILQISNSPALFGLVSAIAFLPMIIMSPIGGIIADRINKQRIMVILDFITAALLLGFILVIGQLSLVPLVSAVLMILYGIQGLYTPAVQASLPLLAQPDRLVQANAVVNLVTSLSGLLGPIIGGVLFGLYGLWPILIVSFVCFLFAAIMELFIVIPHHPQPGKGSILQIARKDMAVSLRFISREQPILLKIVLLVFFFNLFMSSLLIIGLPVIMTQILGLSNQLYGISQGLLAAGGILGGITGSILGSKLKIQTVYLLLFLCAAGLVPISLVLLLGVAPFISYIIISITSLILMACATLSTIQFLTFVQMQTPQEIVGKVISFLMAICLCAQPLGQLIYGILFEKLIHMPWVIVMAGAIFSAGIALFSKSIFSQIQPQEKATEQLASMEA